MTPSCDYFKNTSALNSVHMDELLKIPPYTGDCLSPSLRDVYDKLTVHVRGLSALGVGAEQYGSLLIPVIMAKLPNDIRLWIACEAQSNVWEIKDILSSKLKPEK